MVWSPESPPSPLMTPPPQIAIAARPTTISGSPAPIELTSTPCQAILPPGRSGNSRRTRALERRLQLRQREGSSRRASLERTPHVVNYAPATQPPDPNPNVPEHSASIGDMAASSFGNSLVHVNA